MSQTIFLALIVTVSVEVPVVTLFFPKQRTKMALAALVTTGLTNWAMNALLPLWLPSHGAMVFWGELGALAVEAIVYSLISRPRDVPRALIASGCANAASYLIGVALW